jgi:hypothetical protein
MIRWLRVVLPPGWTFVLAGFIYLVMQFYARVLEWVSNVPFFSTSDQMTAPFMTFLAMLYAFYRVVVFHPAMRPDYCDWLRGTPWTSQKPLPLGPIHLVWQDVVIVGVALAVVSPMVQWRFVQVIQTLLMAYVLALAMVDFLTGQRLWSYAMIFGVGAMMLFWPDPRLFFPIAAVSYGVAWLAVRESLARFPWEGSGTLEAFHRHVRVAFFAQKHLQVRALGWPHDQMGPRFSDLSIRSVAVGLTTWRDILLTGMLVGWFFYVFLALIHIRRNPAMGPESFRMAELASYLFCSVFIIGVRLCIYLESYRPPLSLLGRLIHLRIIIPGFDRVFVAPLLAIMVGVAASNLIVWTTINSMIIVPVSATLTWWILFGVGPSLQTWRLTGNHRIARGIFQKDMVQTS